MRVSDNRFDGGEAEECVLLYPDGRYHAEHTYQGFNDKPSSRIAEGQLSTDKLDQLRDATAIPAFQTLKQTDLTEDRAPGASTFSVWVVRSGKVQQLRFRGQSSQRPYEASLRPIRDALVSLVKDAKRDENLHATRCMPEKVRLASAPALANSAQPLLAFTHDRLYRAGEGVATECVMVGADGAVQVEFHTSSTAGTRTDRAYSGKLGPDKLAGLRRLIDAPEVRATTTAERDQNHLSRYGFDDRIFWIGRGAAVQELELHEDEPNHKAAEILRPLAQFSEKLLSDKALQHTLTEPKGCPRTN